MKRLVYLLGIVATVCILASCGNQQEAANKKEKLQVMTTFYPMYDFTKEVVGDEGEVELLIPAGTDSHDYEPSAKDMAKIQNADVFVYNNENMETWGWPYTYIRSGTDARVEIGSNSYYLYGANTEAAQDALQGLTAAGAYLDEAALFPQSFIDQAIGRCSVDGWKIWMN